MRLRNLAVDAIEDLFDCRDVSFSSFLDELPCDYVYIPDIAGINVNASTHLCGGFIGLASKRQAKSIGHDLAAARAFWIAALAFLPCCARGSALSHHRLRISNPLSGCTSYGPKSKRSVNSGLL